MGFWPGKEYTVHLKCSAEDVLHLLRLNTYAGKPIQYWPYGRYRNKLLLGEVTPNGFEVTPVFRGRDTTRPVFKGTVTAIGDESEIHIVMQLNEYAKTFILVWMSVCMTFMLLILLTVGETPFNLGMLMPLVLCAFGYGVMRLGFRLTVQRSKDVMNKALELPTDPSAPQ